MPDKTTWDYAKYRLEKSSDELDTAQVDFAAEKYGAAANRAYYAIFHAIRSVLALDRVDFRKHSGVLGYFNKEYLATDILNREYSALIKKASVIRNAGDYNDFYVTEREEAEEIIRQAGTFCQAVGAYVLDRIEEEQEQDRSPGMTLQ